MLKLNTLTIKNFMSVGNNTQTIDLDREDLVLILGENLDLGGDSGGSRNGVGKTSILNAISYALFGEALNNIRKENLINKSNGKNMLVTLGLESMGVKYKIERGRKPNVLKFFINGTEQNVDAEDASQGDSRETQKQITDILGMSTDMFKHVIALNTYTEPFLSLKANDQRIIIEQLLGITLLSEKADRLREQIKQTKDAITQEDFKIRAIQEANVRIEQQIDSLTKRQRLWDTKHATDIDELSTAISELNQIDLDKEIENHHKWEHYNRVAKERDHLQKLFNNARKTLEREQEMLEKSQLEYDSLANSKCYTCGQHINNQADQLELKQSQIQQSEIAVANQVKEVNSLLEQIHSQEILEKPDAKWYDRIDDAVAHRSNLENLLHRLEARQRESNPYTEQISEMKQHALQNVDYTRINELKKLQEHEDFLIKLLTNKDSFIRKKIIDQNLTYLNSRLRYYILKMGLPHSVTFENDLSVSISELGRDLDFDNLSRGERNRLILSLSWSFRDVWENLYQKINLLFVDEMIDNGLDQAGVENSLSILKYMARERQRSIWLISHRDELSARVGTVLKVIKENGFTQFSDL